MISALVRTPFWFLRHGQTDWNAKDLSQGNIDIPLNATGIAQAHEAAAKLVGRGIASIVASPLSRAQDTAKIISAALGLDVSLIPDLHEVSFGVQEGQEMGDWFHSWIDGEFTPEGGESFEQLGVRAVRAANQALRSPAPVLIVAHGALFRALRVAMGLRPDVRTQNCVPMFCTPKLPSWDLLEA